MSDLRSLIVREARKLLHTPFKDKGRNLNGVDCVGVCELPARALNLLPATFRPPRNYSALPNGELESLLKDAGCKRKSFLRRLPGDILVLTQANQAGHLAIYTQHGEHEMLVHAHQKRGYVTEERLSKYTHRRSPARIMACYTFPGVAD